MLSPRVREQIVHGLFTSESNAFATRKRGAGRQVIGTPHVGHENTCACLEPWPTPNRVMMSVLHETHRS